MFARGQLNCTVACPVWDLLHLTMPGSEVSEIIFRNSHTVCGSFFVSVMIERIYHGDLVMNIQPLA